MGDIEAQRLEDGGVDGGRCHGEVSYAVMCGKRRRVTSGVVLRSVFVLSFAFCVRVKVRVRLRNQSQGWDGVTSRRHDAAPACHAAVSVTHGNDGMTDAVELCTLSTAIRLL